LLIALAPAYLAMVPHGTIQFTAHPDGLA